MVFADLQARLRVPSSEESGCWEEETVVAKADPLLPRCVTSPCHFPSLLFLSAQLFLGTR